MIAKVADASVIAALAFGEPRADEAAALLQDAILYEPLLLPFELVSVARKKCLAHPERAVAIRTALDLALALDVHWVEVDFPAVLQMSLDTGLTAYDTAYLYVARALRATLVTFDERLARAAGFSAAPGMP